MESYEVEVNGKVLPGMLLDGQIVTVLRPPMSRLFALLQRVSLSALYRVVWADED